MHLARRPLSALLMAGALVASSRFATAQAPRPMTTDDGLNMPLVSNPIMTPDGRWVLFTRSELNWKENKRETTMYLVSSDGGQPYRYIGEAGGRDFRFSPDGIYLAFLRDVKDTAQIFVMHTQGGEAQQLSSHATAVQNFRWRGSHAEIVFTADEARTSEDQKAFKAGDDAIFVDEGPNGQSSATWRNLWSIDIKTKTERPLTRTEFIVGDFDVSSDGAAVAFTARRENRRNQGHLSELFTLDLSTNTQRQLTHNDAPESDPLWSPQGDAILFSAPSLSTWDLRLPKLWLVSVTTQEIDLLSSAFEGNIANPTWSPDGHSIWFTGQQGTNTNLFRLARNTKTVHQVTHLTGTLQSESFSADRTRMVYTYQNLTSPVDIYTSPSGKFEPIRLTTTGALVRDSFLLAESQIINWASTDGTSIEGILLTPSGHDSPEPLPLLLHIHGGPAGNFANRFNAAYHVWAGLGYAQLLPNVRGSSGYTDELLRGNMRDIGEGDYDDLMTGVDYVIQLGIAHADSLAVRGWSYGGILGGWTITQTDRFKAASLGAMVADWTSEYGPGFNYDVKRWYIGGTPWDNADAWRSRSALTHVGSVTTPTILLHGMNDRTDTEAQSMMFYSALKDQGKTVRYLRFPREPHGFREPRHQRIRDVEEIRWIQRYVRGVDWTPWERDTATTSTLPATIQP